MQRNNQLRGLIEGAIVAVIASILSYFPITYGGTMALVFGGIPITLYALRRGFKAAIFASFMWGLLQFVMGNAIVLSPIQFIVEYPIAFAFNGFAGLLAPAFHRAMANGQSNKAYLAIFNASVLGTLMRYIFHFIGGVLFWSQYAPAGMSPIWFSFVPNAISVPLTALPVFVVVALLYRAAPHLFVVRS